MTLLAGVTVIGARRGVAGLVAGLGTMATWAIVNIVAGLEPLLGLLLAVGVGVGLATLAKYLNGIPAFQPSNDIVATGLGAVGGLIMGLGLILAFSLGFPTRPNPGAGTLDYPSGSLPTWLLDGVNQSIIQRTLTSKRKDGGLDIWESSKLVRAFLLPDRNR